jgi:hypothetical protein
MPALILWLWGWHGGTLYVDTTKKAKIDEKLLVSLPFGQKDLVIELIVSKISLENSKISELKEEPELPKFSKIRKIMKSYSTKQAIT